MEAIDPSLPALLSVPFWMPDLGLRQIRGSLFLEDDLLVIDVVDSLMGEWDKDRHVVKIEYDALNGIGIQKGLFYDRLLLRPKEATLLQLIPGDYIAEIALKVWRVHRKKLEALLHSFWVGV